LNASKGVLSREDSIQHIIQLATRFLQSDPTSSHAKDLICIADDDETGFSSKNNNLTLLSELKKFKDDVVDIMIVDKVEESDDDLRIIEADEFMSQRKHSEKRNSTKSSETKRRDSKKAKRSMPRRKVNDRENVTTEAPNLVDVKLDGPDLVVPGMFFFLSCLIRVLTY
jgi:hypothetical protein